MADFEQLELPLDLPFAPSPPLHSNTPVVQLAELQHINRQRILAQVRAGFQLNPIAFLEARLDVLIEMLVLDDETRTNYEIRAEQRISELLDQVDAQSRQAALHKPNTPTGSGLYVPR